ncbi:oral-facial-digital syndrome 1 protein-like [Argonauta hians]
MMRQDYLSADQLREKLYYLFKRKGIIDYLKTRMRHLLVEELQKCVPGNILEKSISNAEGSQSILLKASNSLVADHLQKCQYEYSMSVFMPESGMAQDKILSNQELLRLLHINPYSDLYKALQSNLESDSKKGFLLELLNVITSVFQQMSHDIGTQTDSSMKYPTSSLDAKLNGVEKIFMDKKEEHYQKAISGVEEKLTSLQKKLEERYQTELQLELSRMKNTDITKLRLEEKENSRRELEKFRQELEKNYQLKMNALLEKERNFTERLKKEEEFQQKDTYQQRQTLLEEVNNLRQKESELTKMMEMVQREKSLDQERLKCQEDLLKQKMNEVNRLESDLQQRIDNEVFKFKIELQNKYLEKSQSMDIREAQIKVNELRTKEEREKFQLLKEDNERKHTRINELETVLQEVRHKEITATKHNDFLNAKLRDMIDYSTIKEQNAVLRKELETEKLFHADTVCKKEELNSRQEELLKDIYRLNQDVITSKQTLDRCRLDGKQEKLLYEEYKQRLDCRLQEEMNKNKELFQTITRQSQQIKELNSKNCQLQTDLMIAEKALHQEISQKAEKVFFQSDENTEKAYHNPASMFGPLKHHIQQQPMINCQRGCIMCSNESHNTIEGCPPKHLRPLGIFEGSGDLSSESNHLAIDDTIRVIQDAKYQSDMLGKETKNLKYGFRQFHSQLDKYPNFNPVQSPPFKKEKERLKKEINLSCLNSDSDCEEGQSMKTLSSTPRKKLYKSVHTKDNRDVALPLPGLDISNLSGDEGDRTKYIKSDDEHEHGNGIIQVLDEPVLQEFNISNDYLNKINGRRKENEENIEGVHQSNTLVDSAERNHSKRSGDVSGSFDYAAKERRSPNSGLFKDLTEEQKPLPVYEEPSYVIPAISLDDAWRCNKTNPNDAGIFEVPKEATLVQLQPPEPSYKTYDGEGISPKKQCDQVADQLSEETENNNNNNKSEIMEESIIESLSQSLMTNSEEDPFEN